MADFEVRFLDAAKEDIAESEDSEGILDKIEHLLPSNPKYGDPLSHELAGLWDLQVGRYRVIYEIDEEEETVWIWGAGLRKSDDRDGIYQRAARWFED